jgi:hypothetical protein
MEERLNSMEGMRQGFLWRLIYRLYLPAVLKGLKNTFLHLVKAGEHRTFTIQYPE